MTEMYTLPKRIILAVLTVIACAVPVMASLNLYYNMGTTNQMGISLANGDEYTISTAGNDPFVSIIGLSRHLNADETVLTFEYCSTADINMLQIFFGPSYSEPRSKICPAIPRSAGWTTYSVNIASEISRFQWGQQGSILRMDFGSNPDVGIIVRHLRITSAENDPGWTADNTNPTLEQTIELGLPVLDITTVNGEEPTCDFVSPPPGSIGGGITNATKVPGRVVRYEPDGTVSFDSGDYVKGSTGMTLKIRGNTSAYQGRKPYKIKLQAKADMLVRGQKKFNDKNWVLLNDYDMLHRNGFWVNELIGMDWTPQCQYVNVRINNEFRGVYLLCEAIERNTDCRINVSKTGFITELDAYWWNEDAYVPSMLNTMWNYTFKYPDVEDLDATTKNYVAATMMQFEKSTRNGTYTKYIDCRSFAAWVLAHDILGTNDYGGSNMYFSKFDNTDQSKLRRPTLWDFDSTEKTKGSWPGQHFFHYKQLFESADKTFVKEYVRLWQTTGRYIPDAMIDRLRRFQNSDEADAYDRSMKITGIRWGMSLMTSQQAIARSINWYNSRQTWLQKTIEDEFGEYFETSGIDQIQTSQPEIIVNGRQIATADSSPITVLTTDGRTVATATTSPVEITRPGLYLIVTNNTLRKIAIP